jgi:class 3 adenylate cyclase
MVTGSVLECKPCRRTGRAAYFGPQLNLAARIANSAHGGQTLLGSSTYNAIDPCIMYELGIRASKLGRFSLKGVRNAEIIYQVGRLLGHASVSEPCAKTGAGGTLFLGFRVLGF